MFKLLFILAIIVNIHWISLNMNICFWHHRPSLQVDPFMVHSSNHVGVLNDPNFHQFPESTPSACKFQPNRWWFGGSRGGFACNVSAGNSAEVSFCQGRRGWFLSGRFFWMAKCQSAYSYRIWSVVSRFTSICFCRWKGCSLVLFWQNCESGTALAFLTLIHQLRDIFCPITLNLLCQRSFLRRKLSFGLSQYGCLCRR